MSLARDASLVSDDLELGVEFMNQFRPEFAAGLPDGQFASKNDNLSKFLRALKWKRWVNFMTVWNILQTFGIFYGHLEI
jgi:hypothetical protein